MSCVPRALMPLLTPLLCLPLVGLLTGCNDDQDENNTNGPGMVVIPSFANAVTALDQRPSDDDRIVVASVTLDAPGYLVIREALPELPELPGKLIGLVPLFESQQNVQVQLDRPAFPGERLFATLHVESNGTSSFDFDQMPGVDPPALDDQGRPASSSFIIETFSGLITVTDQSIEHPVWIDTVSIAAVDNPAPRGFVAIHAELEDLTTPLGVVALAQPFSRDVEVTLNQPVFHQTQLHAVIHQDLGVPGIFEPELDLPVRDETSGEPVSASFTVTLDPAPDADLSCVATRPTCTQASTLLPLELNVRADHPGSLLVRYMDAQGEARAALYPVEQGTSTQSELMLPEAACHTRFEVSLLVDVEGVDPLSASALPYATSNTGSPAVCSVGVQRELVDALLVDPANTLSMTSTLAGFERLPNAAAFITVSATDDSGQATDLLGFARQTQPEQMLDFRLVRPLLLGETLIVNAYTDEGELGVFEREEADKPVLAFGPLEQADGESAQYISSTRVIDQIGTSEAFITVDDQAPEQADTIVVRQSVAARDALVVVYEDDMGRPGDALGFVAVEAGAVRDIEVTLSRDTTPGERLHVWLLEDDGNQIYDDIFTDTVYVRDAAPVMQIIRIEETP